MSAVVNKPYHVLCTLFDTETKNGMDMDKYTDLLKKAVDQVVHFVKGRVIRNEHPTGRRF